jgi:hypothetical protein
MRYYHLSILALSGFVTSFGAHIVATNLPSYAEVAGVGALMIGLLIAIYDLAELFAKRVFEKSQFCHIHRLCFPIPASKQLGQTLVAYRES